MFSSTQFRDRRSVPRINTDIPVEIYEEKKLKLIGIGQIHNIGINCAGLDTMVTFIPNQTIVIRFLIDTNYLVQIWAKIIRVVNKNKKRYYGIRFEKIDLLAKQNLEKFINQKIREQILDEGEI